MEHLNGHLALSIDFSKLGIDVVADELGDFVQREVGYESDGEFAF